ncbi:hypothetical protein HPP92_020945 [Vanilla planifolia]|uniref:Uncharacterized protein n=1 Tax=Vanilla planifolia TaxID=51239 RepID=A0A835PX77_VANPL|nr:hypothetical protein HPP92_020945 [Vanilla planifolia]
MSLPSMEEGGRCKRIPARATLLLLLSTAAGASLLVWWIVMYHQSNDKLWMVPVSLILIGTPLISCFSFYASAGSDDSLGLLCKETAPGLLLL